MSKFNVDKITVSQTQCFFDNKTGTKVYEKPSLMQYESQHFKCKAIIELEECVADRNWTIGLIQACDSMYLENRYGRHGSSFWEFHPIKSGRHRMVNDSDGRQYPFYSVTSSKCEVTRGAVHNCVVKLQYADHFYPTVVWELPYCGGAKLTEVIRRQDFWIWLVAVRRAGHYNRGNDVFHVGKDELYILRSMRWHYCLHMRFDPDERVGNRLRSVADRQVEEPSILLHSDEPVPLSAVHPPHCNAAQSLIWYPRVRTGHHKPELLVPPRQAIVPWDRWSAEMLPGLSPRPQRPRELRVCPLWSKDSDIGVAPAKVQQPLPSSETSPAALAENPMAERLLRAHKKRWQFLKGDGFAGNSRAKSKLLLNSTDSSGLAMSIKQAAAAAAAAAAASVV
ncbi:hypothetical protein BOX15_Mlig016010g4 [Macrostomum lignano]|uniref:Uncharacterized protein n=2 Tax=Macrostomum lignano TaxID=282301 RepID=A0A267DKR8_9PLAT|nr:hypothetical protein BOX15_Mlig016010g4 [Macrostomum lignano]